MNEYDQISKVIALGTQDNSNEDDFTENPDQSNNDYFYNQQDDGTKNAYLYYKNDDESSVYHDDDYDSGSESVTYDDPDESQVSVSASTEMSNDNEEPQDGPSRRFRIVEEVLATEKAYVHNLFLTIKNFLLPLKQILGTSEQLLKEDQISAVFDNLDDIYRVNSDFLSELEGRFQEGAWNDETDTVADLFLMKIPDFASFYPHYVESHQKSIMTLRQLDKKQSWVAFCQKVKERGEVGKLDISALLIMPVQRIPRYEYKSHIDLLKVTPETHPEHADLKQAIKEITDIASSVNFSMRKQDNYKRLCKIEKNLNGLPQPIAEENRMFIKEGPLWKVCRKIPKKRYFFVFSDLLIYTAMPTPSGAYKFNRQFKLEDSKTKIKDLRDTDDIKNALQVIGLEKSFTVYAESPEEKQAWMRSFHTIASMKASVDTGVPQFSIESDDAPVWIPDNKTKICMLCGVYFTVVKRRHHCRNCGKVICGNCSNYKKKLPNTDKDVRVCRICFNYLKLKDGTYEEKPVSRSRSGTASADKSPVVSHSPGKTDTQGKEGGVRRGTSSFFLSKGKAEPSSSGGTLSKKAATGLPPPAAAAEENDISSKQFRMEQKDLTESLSKIWARPPAAGQTNPPPVAPRRPTISSMFVEEKPAATSTTEPAAPAPKKIPGITNQAFRLPVKKSATVALDSSAKESLNGDKQNQSAPSSSEPPTSTVSHSTPAAASETVQSPPLSKAPYHHSTMGSSLLHQVPPKPSMPPPKLRTISSSQLPTHQPPATPNTNPPPSILKKTSTIGSFRDVPMNPSLSRSADLPPVRPPPPVPRSSVQPELQTPQSPPLKGISPKSPDSPRASLPVSPRASQMDMNKPPTSRPPRPPRSSVPVEHN